MPSEGAAEDALSAHEAAAQGCFRGGAVPFQVAVHDGEEDLQEQVDGVD